MALGTIHYFSPPPPDDTSFIVSCSTCKRDEGHRAKIIVLADLIWQSVTLPVLYIDSLVLLYYVPPQNYLWVIIQRLPKT